MEKFLEARRINSKTVEIFLTRENFSEFPKITRFLKKSKMKHSYRVYRYDNGTILITIRVKVRDEMDEAILRSLLINIPSKKELQEISRHCLMVPMMFRRNKLLKAIASYS